MSHSCATGAALGVIKVNNSRTPAFLEFHHANRHKEVSLREFDRDVAVC